MEVTQLTMNNIHPTQNKSKRGACKVSTKATIVHYIALPSVLALFKTRKFNGHPSQKITLLYIKS